MNIKFNNQNLSIKTLINHLKDITTKAGNIILKGKENIRINKKEDGQPVTQSDKNADHLKIYRPL